MEIPELTPQRQKMLIGAAAAGLLLLVGFSFAPQLEVADDETRGEVDQVLSLVEDEHELRQGRQQGREPRPFRREHLLDREPASVTAIGHRTDSPPSTAFVEQAADPEPAQVTPPAYRRRLQLLDEEEAALRRHSRQAHDGLSAEPVPTVTVASVESVESEMQDVEQALAEARRPQRWRRVELVDGAAPRSRAPAAPPRGAWLSGGIEIE
jgi:hypothetical protein